MKTTLPVDPAPYARAALGEMQCRRYLFDRAEWEEPHAPLGEMPAPGRSASNPSSVRWEDGLGRQR